MKVDCEKIKKRRCEGFKKKKSEEKGKKELGKKKGGILKNKEGWKNILEYMNKEVKKSECCEKKGKKFKKEKIRKSEKGNQLEIEEKIRRKKIKKGEVIMLSDNLMNGKKIKIEIRMSKRKQKRREIEKIEKEKMDE